jgi:PqqD family protein of HPr-rel-A system
MLRSLVDSLSHQTIRRYLRSPHAEGSNVGERVVLYHRQSGKALVLNPTGSWLWQRLTTSPTPQALAEQLQARFPSLTGEQAVSDVSTFLEELVQHGMVRVEE